MSDRRRVVITGLGAVSPVGNTAEDSWNAVRNGKSGLGPITLFDTSRVDVTIAAEVKNFDIERYGIPSRAARKLARFSAFCLAASVQAVDDAGYAKEDLQKDKAGVLVGNCFGGTDAISEAFKKIDDPALGPARIPPLTAPLMLYNEAAANINIYYGLKGFSWALGTACASGTDALGLATDLIRSGRCDVCLAGGTEATITEFTIASFHTLQALAHNFNNEPEKASRPFDKDREGFVFGEGSAMFVLEELEHAKARGARIYAEIAGFGSSCDAFHITAPLKDGSGAALAVREALDDAGMRPQDIQYYNAHGTSTKANDAGESAMIKSVFGEHAYNLHISSTKSETGHLVGAAGAIEALFCVKAINENFVPPTINLDSPDIAAGCDLDYTPHKGIDTRIDATASASLGFGGHNACIVIRRYAG